MRAVLGGGVDVALRLDRGRGPGRPAADQSTCRPAPARRRPRSASTTRGHVGDRDEGQRGRRRTTPVGDASTARRPRPWRSRRAGGRARGRRCRCRRRTGGTAPRRRARRARATTRAAPTKKSADGDLASAPRPTTASTTPPVRASTAGISPAGSACAIDPTVVPRLRMVGWATLTQRLAQQRQRGIRRVVVLELRVADQRADPHPASSTVDVVEPGDLVDVDEVRRARPAAW